MNGVHVVPVLPQQLAEVIERQRYNGNNTNNQNRVKTGNPDYPQNVQGENAQYYHGDRQAKGKGYPFYDVYLPEEYQCPDKAGEKEDKYEPEERPDDRETLQEG